MGDKSPRFSFFGDLSWLQAFQSDGYRFAAIAVIALVFFGIWGLPQAMKTWADDRKDRRRHEEKKLSLVQGIERRIARQKAERFDLDA